MDGVNKSGDIAALSLEDLQAEYEKVIRMNKTLKETSEIEAQQIHELKRSLQTANASQAYLLQELEALTNANTENEGKRSGRLQNENEDMRSKLRSMQEDYAALQQDFDNLVDTNTKLQEKVKTTQEHESLKIVDLPDTTICQERLESLERENLDLLHKLGQLEEKQTQSAYTATHLQKNVDVLQDQVNCLEENLSCKRKEITEKDNLLESTQDELADANAKLAALISAPENGERKGNSLFAEVDDQRQAMRQLLGAQKKSYLEMKKIYNESEHEIRRLKRENGAIHTELRACISLFCNADKVYQDKLNERIRQLMNQNEELEKKVKWTQERVKDMANTNGVLWLDSILNFCKLESNEMKQQLHSIRIEKASLEEQLRYSQQEMARWRFESLKMRCTLMNRENILKEHKIAFGKYIVLDSDFAEKAMQADWHASNNMKKVTEKLQNDAVDEKNDKHKAQQMRDNSVTIPSAPKLLVREDIEVAELGVDCHESADMTTQSEPIKSVPRKDLLPGPSILCKPRSFPEQERNKRVQLPDDVPKVATGDESASKTHRLLRQEGTPKMTQKRDTVQKIRTKSNVIVRRVVVSSKADPLAHQSHAT